MALSVGKVLGEIELQDNFTARIIRAANQIANFTTKLETLGPKVQAIGDRMTMGLTAPIVAVGALSLKASIDFESSFAGVRKTVDGTAAQMNELAGGIRNMAKEMPLSVNEINKVAEAAGQLGVKRENILDFTKVMVQLGATTNLSADDAATAMARFSNIMGTPITDVSKLGNALVALGNDGASTEAEIMSMALRIAGAGKTVGMTEGQVLGMANALSSLGIEAEMGGSAISKSMINMAMAVSGGGDKLNELASVAMPNVTDAGAKFAAVFRRDAGEAMAMFIGGLGNIQKNGGDLLKTLANLDVTETRLRDTMLRVAGGGDIVAKSMMLGNQQFANGTALVDEYNKRLDTNKSKLEILKGRVYDMAISFGDSLVPALMSTLRAMEPILGVIERVIKAFGALPGPIQTSIIGFAVFVAALGPLLSIVGRITTTVGLMSAAYLKLQPLLFTMGNTTTMLTIRYWAMDVATKAAAASTWLLNAAMLALPWVALAAAVAGIAFGIYKLVGAFKDLWTAIKEGNAIDHLMKRDTDNWARRLIGWGDEAVRQAERVKKAQRDALVTGTDGKGNFTMNFKPVTIPTNPLANITPTAGERAGWASAAAGGAAGLPSAMTLGEELKAAQNALKNLDPGKMREYTEAIRSNVFTQEELVKRTGLSAQAIKLLSDRVDAGTKSTKDAAAYQKELAKQSEEYARANRLYDFERELYHQSVRAGIRLSQEQVPLLNTTKHSTLALAEVTKGLGQTSVYSRDQWAAMTKEQEKGKRIIDEAAKAIENQNRIVHAGIDVMARFGQNMGQILGGDAGEIVSELSGAFGDLADSMRSATEAGMSVGESVAVASNVYTLAITGVMMWIKAMDKANQKRKEELDWMREMGGVRGLNAQAALIGMPNYGSQLRSEDQTKPMKLVRAEIEAAQERLERYGLTWRDLGADVRKLNIESLSLNLLKDWGELQRMGIDATSAMAGGLSDLVIEAKRTGTQIPKALQPMLESLIRSKKLSEEAARALLGLADDGVPSFDEIKDAASRYGLELDKLGPKIAQLNINEMADQLAKDWDILMRGGADANVVMGAMKGKVQDVVTQALRLGLTLPESMRPIIQAMIESGQLTDEFGGKLLDTSRLEFARPLVDAIDDLIGKLGELIDQFSDVGKAAEDGFGRARDAASQTTGTAIPRPGSTPPSTTPPPDPGSTPAGGSGTRPSTATLNVNLDGRRIARTVVPLVAEEMNLQGV